MAEVKARNFVFFALIMGGVGFVLLTFFGVIGGIGWFNPQWLQNMFKKGASAVQGYTPAKTPNEAVDNFKRAIQDRRYDQAALYCTEPYAKLLRRAHPAASEIGATIDKIHNYGKNKGFATDKTTFAFLMLDPFPKNFRVGTAPTEVKGKTITSFQWDLIEYKKVGVEKDTVWQSMDMKMFQNVLGGPTRKFGPADQIEIVKEGDVYKLNIATTDTWEHEVTYFLEHYKTYNSNLDRFKGDMLNERFSSETYESEILAELRKSKM